LGDGDGTANGLALADTPVVETKASEMRGKGRELWQPPCPEDAHALNHEDRRSVTFDLKKEIGIAVL
jgi:hypothetical protein